MGGGGCPRATGDGEARPMHGRRTVGKKIQGRKKALERVLWYFY